MDFVNFLFEELGWGKIDLDFLKVKKGIVPSKMFSSKKIENKFVEIWEKMSLEEKMKMEPEDWDEFEEWAEKK